jgi:eukaryotic-like serine/threonine-protein kinase
MGDDRIGPYRLEGRLGAGGMGEVFSAYDERLDRRVALKLIRSDLTGGASQERFRREARAAAGLSHPSIVQIHDILESARGSAIVMELVEGQSLRRRLAAGPLPYQESLRLGREIAEGLAAAHARGVVHRDLKPDNVMITTLGHAKILDFGLAKLAGDSPLTESGIVLGTFRSMSPEQARGLPLGPGSDLFSFGSLLYEMIAGRSPFSGPDAPETLARICTERQTPLREVCPEASEPVARLVDRLLEKDPARRPESAADVARALALEESGEAFRGEPERTAGDEEPTVAQSSVLPHRADPADPVEPVEHREPSRGGPRRAFRRAAIGLAVALGAAALALGFWRLAHRPGPPLVVAVPAPTIAGAGPREGGEGAANADPAADTAEAAAALRIAVLRALTGLERVSPLAPEQVDPVAGAPRELARATAADEVVVSRLACTGRGCWIELSRVRGGDGVLLWTAGFEVPLHQPFLLAEAVDGQLRTAYRERRPRPGLVGLEVRPADYARYVTLRRELDSRRADLSIDALLAGVAAIRRGSPRFVEAAILEADARRYRYAARRDPEDLKRAEQVLDQTRARAPDDPRPLVALFEIAMRGERLDRAAEALEALERLEPGDPRIAMLSARLEERRGNRDAALARMREAAARRPSWQHLSRLADMEYRYGETAAAREHLALLLARDPESWTGTSLLAQIELLSGSPARAAALYEKLVRRSPQAPELANLGLAYLLLGRYAQAVARFRQALDLEPGNAFVALNLADAIALSGDRLAAEAVYRGVLDRIGKDPAVESSWQLLSARAQAYAHLGRRGDAVAAAQRVLALAADNAQAAYEVALVYTLVGDRASALLNAERALARGVEPRWFDLPWLAPLREEPELRERLKRPGAPPP